MNSIGVIARQQRIGERGLDCFGSAEALRSRSPRAGDCRSGRGSQEVDEAGRRQRAARLAAGYARPRTPTDLAFR